MTGILVFFSLVGETINCSLRTKYLGAGAAAYQLGNTSSRTITEVKQR